MNPIDVRAKAIDKRTTLRAFVTYDTLFSMIVLVVMLFEIIYTVSTVIHRTNNYKRGQNILNNLVIVGDYVVNHCVVKTGVTSDDVLYPGRTELTSICWAGLKDRFGFHRLDIGFSKTDGEVCIYRIVLQGSSPKMLYVCGD